VSKGENVKKGKGEREKRMKGERGKIAESCQGYPQRMRLLNRLYGIQ